MPIGHGSHPRSRFGAATLFLLPLILAACAATQPQARGTAGGGLSGGGAPDLLAGETELLRCADPAAAKTLVDRGLDPLALTANGESGLHLAARRGNAGMARFYLERGVDPLLRDRNGATALDVAREIVLRGASAAPVEDAVRATRARVAPRTGRSSGSAAGARMALPDPDLARKAAAVVAMIEDWVGESLRKETAAGDLAVQQGNPAEAMAVYVAALDRVSDAGIPAEQDLRVKIVRLAASAPRPPELPEKAREHVVRASYLLKKGQDVSLVEKEMAAALRLAPWWAEGYYKMAEIQAEQNKFDAAERNLRVFVAGAPNDPRARAAQDRIVEIGMAKEVEDRFLGMQGRWVDTAGTGYSVTVRGDKILARSDGGLEFSLARKNGILEGSVEGKSHPGEHGCTIPGQMHPVNGKLSPDAGSMTLEYLWSRYKTNFHWVNMAGVPSGKCLLCDEVCDSVVVSATDRVTLRLSPARQEGKGR